MTNDSTISRRTFLATAIATGTIPLTTGQVLAQLHASPHSIELGRQIESIGRVLYIQFHTQENFSLETAAITIEQLAHGRVLEKVSAMGNATFEDTPDDYLATLYYDRDLKGTILSTKSIDGVIGVVRGETGSIILKEDTLTVRDEKETELFQTGITFRSLSGGSASYSLILESLREEKTIFA